MLNTRFGVDVVEGLLYIVRPLGSACVCALDELPEDVDLI